MIRTVLSVSRKEAKETKSKQKARQVQYNNLLYNNRNIP